MAKIYRDKYYTPRRAVLKVIEQIEKDIMPINEFTRIIEPSAGGGAFLKELPAKTIGYDIEPEYEGIIQGDYLKQDIAYMNNSLVIGNPPFGNGSLGHEFIKKSLEHSDYVAFIIPADNYKKQSSIKGVKLFKSYLLPELKYSGVKLKCCFNIYIRGQEENVELDSNKILFYSYERRSKNEDKSIRESWMSIDSDFRIVAFGTLKLLEKNDKKVRVKEIKIKLHKKVLGFEIKLKKILEIKVKNSISTPSISEKELKKFIWDNFEELRAEVQ